MFEELEDTSGRKFKTFNSFSTKVSKTKVYREKMAIIIVDAAVALLRF